MVYKWLVSGLFCLTLLAGVTSYALAGNALQMDMPTETPQVAAPLPETIGTPQPDLYSYGTMSGTATCMMMGGSGMGNMGATGSMAGMGMGMSGMGMNGMSGMTGMGMSGMSGMSGMTGMGINGMSSMGSMTAGMDQPFWNWNPWVLLGWVALAAAMAAILVAMVAGIVMIVRRART